MKYLFSLLMSSLMISCNAQEVDVVVDPKKLDSFPTKDELLKLMAKHGAGEITVYTIRKWSIWMEEQVSMEVDPEDTLVSDFIRMFEFKFSYKKDRLSKEWPRWAYTFLGDIRIVTPKNGRAWFRAQFTELEKIK